MKEPIPLRDVAIRALMRQAKAQEIHVLGGSMTDYLFCRCDYFTEDGEPWYGEDGAVRVEDPSCTAHEPIFTWEEE